MYKHVYFKLVVFAIMAWALTLNMGCQPYSSEVSALLRKVERAGVNLNCREQPSDEGETELQQVAAPTILSSASSGKLLYEISIACETAGAKVRYTENGTEPTPSSTLYVDSFTISGEDGDQKTIKANAWKEGMTVSATASRTYHFEASAQQQVAAPVILSTLSSGQLSYDITISCETTGAIIRYTEDGSDPTPAATAYAGPFVLSGADGSQKTVKARAWKDGMGVSAVTARTYLFGVPTAGDEHTLWLAGSVPLSLVRVPAGAFMMGPYPGEQDSYDDELPQHKVTISRDFWMSKYEVTQAQWRAIMGDNPSYFPGDNKPVECVSWIDIRGTNGFLAKLNAAHPNRGFRLPTEAEWEYACRAGTTTRFYWGDDLNCTQIGAYAWFRDNASGATKPVGQKLPNAFDLYDMCGNVYEWCEDDWHYGYNGAPINGGAWIDAPRGAKRLMRGVSYDSVCANLRSAYRNGYLPEDRYINVGFRVVADAEPI